MIQRLYTPYNLIGQIGHSATNGSPLLRQFKKSFVARGDSCSMAQRQAA